jgi:hypothetical protein
MKTNNLTLLTLALAAVFILFGINYISTLSQGNTTKPSAIGNLAINPAEVKGMAIEKGGKVFTLNKEQQTRALSFINNMAPVDKKDYPTKGSFEFSRIIIYRFNGENIELAPVALTGGDLVFDVPALNSDSYFLSLSAGELTDLIRKATAK